MIRIYVGLFLMALAVSFGIALLTRYIVMKRQLLNVPISRSLHSTPMPSMGGLGIMLGFWITMGIGCRVMPSSVVAWSALLALVAGTWALSVILIDDIRPMRVLPKLCVLLVATGASVALGLRLEEIHGWSLGKLALPASVFWFVWMMNLYNFMDGIDAIAAGEAITVSAFLVAFSAMEGKPAVALPALVLAGAAIGFLLLNFPPSRMFMGDIGSNFIGFMFAGLAILVQREGMSFLVVPWLLGAFIFDTTYTLLRRLLRGENILQAHKSHLYQRLVLMGWSQGQVNLALLGVNLVLGAGAYSYLRGNGSVALLMLALALAVLICGTVLIERAERRRA